jgi:ribonuclease-3
MGPREEAVGGRKRPSVLAGALKALIAAAVLATRPDDSRLAIRGLVLRLLGPPLARFERDPGTDYKATLQDWVQREHRTVPIYRTVGESGSPHARVFTVAVRLKGKVLGTGSGHTRREADQKAARNALAKLRVGGSPP